MSRKFNRLTKLTASPEKILPLSQDKRYVIFSDHHKGDGSRADDFKKNAEIYLSALSYYGQEGYELLVLGDSEELWENDISSILNKYADIIHQEIQLAPTSINGRKIRIWGNHDKEVTLKSFAHLLRKLKNHPFADVEFHEAVSLGGDILLVHGHQGRFFEDKAWRISRWAVHFIWKSIQKIFNIGIDGPAENPHLRNQLEEDYYRWAKQNKRILICGHTHRAMFASLSHYHYLLRQRSILLNLGWPDKQFSSPPNGNKLHFLEKEIQRVLQKSQGLKPPSFDPDPLPCYFNSGCCGYTNGITAIEIQPETIRLIKWEKKRTRRILQEGNLQEFIYKTKYG